MTAYRVLVVDDSRTIQLIVASVLAEDPEITIVGTAGSAAQAEAFFGAARIDAVTLDVEMPGVGGLAYLRRLVKRAVPVVMVSTRVAKGDPVRDEALRRGASACFAKADVVERAIAFRQLVKDAARRDVALNRHDAAIVGASRAA